MKIKNTGKALIGFANDPALQFQPGINTVPDEKWAEVNGHVVMKAHLNSGALVELKSGKEKPEADKPKVQEAVASIKALDLKEAVAAVKKLKDLEVLYAVGEADERDEVAGAAVERIEKLEKSKQPE